MTEIWKDINGYEGYYKISNLGRVKSVTRFVSSSRTNHKTQRAKEIVGWDNGHGYLVVSLSKEGRRKNHYIHRLVAEHFVDNPNNYKVINHKDYDRTNNRCDNLEWCTQLQNIRHSVPNMCHSKNSKPPKKTGERYIQYREHAYKIVFKHKYYGRYETLEDAIRERDKLNEQIGYFQ